MQTRFLLAAGRERQSGQSMVEYTILVGVVVAIFMFPFDGNPPLLQQFADAIGASFDRYLSAVALPM